MKWSKELPTKPGLYAWRIAKGCEPSFVRLIQCYDTITKTTDLYIDFPVFSTLTQHPVDIGGEWAGPIEEPEE